MGVEMYIQSDFGTPAFNNGVQPSLSLLFDQSLPLNISIEYIFGINGAQNSTGQIAYQFSNQWSLQRQIVPDFDVFFSRLLRRGGPSTTGRISDANKFHHSQCHRGGIWRNQDAQ
jgi:hypothetical protein